MRESHPASTGEGMMVLVEEMSLSCAFSGVFSGCFNGDFNGVLQISLDGSTTHEEIDKENG